MLKWDILMKDGEIRARDALRKLLERVPIVEINEITSEAASGEEKPDMVARLVVDGRQHELVCEYKPNGQPRYARSALLELRDYARQSSLATPIFIAPYISPAVRQLCEEKGVGYLDLKGNARIAFGGVFIERIVAENSGAEQRELKSLFRPKSAQVLRAMLREPDRSWRVTDLSEVSGVSLGHVSNVRTALIDREWALASAEGLLLTKPDELLDAWRDSYTAPSGERMRFYTPLHGTALEDAARSVLSAGDGPGHAAFASFSAAHWLAPYGRTGTHYLYADPEGVEKMRVALRLAPASKGENVLITIPKDAGLLADTVEPAPGAICTDPIQTYLDLSIAGERGAEAAEHLRREKLSWPK
ncbi:type IV toxin-antitoxin system AbiEi family antitoxin [Paraburkholderia unamae]|uniref:type IV toxin-antitoxin system AbiEi family antitoxin n=1 Tax=Paraburkholderia unamae TaxID=219649 RepID=UPI000DD2FA03|nr:type IV toxin-antitoxin system AbiEi family antitoxin [Paraburkholderia unamae]